jgi:rod shape-determining protein MreD
VKTGVVLLAIGVAVVLQTTLARFFVRGTVAVDLVLVAVVGVALKSDSVTGLLSGAGAGLLQDALSTGVVGIGGLSKTVVGFLAGIVGTQFIVAHALPRFVVFFGAAVLHAMVFIGLYVLLGFRQAGLPYAAVAGQAVGNAIVGVAALELADLLPGVVERHRAARGRVRRQD